MQELEVSGCIATVTLANAPVNALSRPWAAAFHDLLDRLEARTDWTLLRIRSALDVFSAGSDLKQMTESFGKPVEEQILRGRDYKRLFGRIEALALPTLAELRGTAMGGGLELALACDLRIAAHEAKLGLPEVRLGLMPGGGGTQRLPRLLGPAASARMILAGQSVRGAEALELGLVGWAVPLAQFDAAAQRIAAGIASLPRHAAIEAKAAIRAAATRLG